MKYFDFNNYKAMAAKIKSIDDIDNRTDLQEMFEEAFRSFLAYVTSVDEMELYMEITSDRGDLWTYKVENYDRRRRSNHEAAIASCNILIRMANQLDCESPCLVDTNDRHQVAECCMEAATAIFNFRRSVR